MVTIADFNQDKFEATDAIRCIKVYIPDGEGYLTLFAGLLALTNQVTNYQDPDSAQAEGVAAIWRDAYIETDWEECEMGGQSNWDFWVFNARWNFAFLFTGNVNQMFGGYASRTGTPVIGDAFSWPYVHARAGDYEIEIQWVRQTNAGNIEFSLDDGSGSPFVVTTLNTAGTFLLNQRTIVSFTLPSDGEYTLIAKAVTPVSPSTGYAMGLVAVSLRKKDA